MVCQKFPFTPGTPSPFLFLTLSPGMTIRVLNVAMLSRNEWNMYEPIAWSLVFFYFVPHSLTKCEGSVSYNLTPAEF